MKTHLLITFLTFYIMNGYAQTAPAAKTSGYAPVNGLKMYYEIQGEGPAVVLLHGSFMTIESNYGTLIPHLAKKNKVIAVELQGHGRTTNIDRPFSYENHASDIRALLDHLKIDKANILGYSLGATVALQVAVLFPEKVNRIVFISSVYKHDGWLKSVQDILAGMTPQQLSNTPLKTEYERVAPNPGDWTSFVTRMIEHENKPFDIGIKQIEKLPGPILIINGDYDGVDMAHSYSLFKAFGGGEFGIMEPTSPSRFAVIPGTTHVTLMMETEKLAELIQPFLAENETHEMVLTRTFDAPVAKIWQAWTDGEWVKRWWGPVGFTSPLAKMDVRPGGRSLVCMSSAAYGDMYNTWTYSQVVPMKRMEFVQHFTDKEGKQLKPSEIGLPPGIPAEVPHTIVFKDLGNGKTEITITEKGYSSNAAMQMSKAGMSQCMDKLATALKN
jgi:pimeloyl-ACP methyl ester carboxylesterase/uncharacterized protein YndB with AHSA1/START domain